MLVSFFPKLPCNRLCKVAVAAGMGVRHGLDCIDFVSLGLFWLPSLLIGLSANTRNSAEPWWHHSPEVEGAGKGAQPAAWWETDYLQPLSSWREQQFVLLGIYMYSEYRLPSLPVILLPVPPSFIDLYNELFTIKLFHIKLLSIKYLIWGEKKCGLASWPWNSLLLPCAPLLKKQLLS